MPEEHPLLRKITEAFARIEIQDVRVGTVQMPLREFEELSHANSPIVHISSTRSELTCGELGKIWGAKIVLSDTFQVIGDAGFERFTYPVDYMSNRVGHLTILVPSRAEFYSAFSKEEWKALSTLRDMITEYEFRKFLKYGFINVKGISGKIYQVFRQSGHIKVWQNGTLLEEICVTIMDRRIPYTDKLIAFKTIIETDENSIYKMGNVYNMRKVA